MGAGKEEIMMDGAFWECAKEDRGVNLGRQEVVVETDPALGIRPQRVWPVQKGGPTLSTIYMGDPEELGQSVLLEV